MLVIHSCLIVKNEETNLPKLIQQLLEFSDEVHITDTGSTDNTVNNIIELQQTYPNIFLHHYEWDMNFSNARNYSFYNYDNKSDFIFWCDADDLLPDPLLNGIKEFKKKNIEDTVDIYELNYMFCKYEPSFLHYRTSILKTSKHYIWKDPIHEYINADEIYTTVSYELAGEGMYIEHQREHVHTDRNLNIFLNMSRTNYKFTSRNYYYFGCELMNDDLKTFAYIAFLSCVYYDENHINAIDSINSAKEIYMLYNDTIPSYLPKPQQVLEFLYNHNIKRADIVYYLGNIAYNQQDYELASKYYHEALSIIHANEIYSFMYNEQETYICLLLQLGCIEFYYTGNYQKTMDYNTELLTIDPNNETAKNNINIIKNYLN